MVIVNTYIDRAMTGTNDMRPRFREMIADSAKKEWDVVLVYKLDRFSRDKYEATVHKRTLKNNGVKVVSAMENIPDTPEGIILEALLEGMNQYYSMELAQKVKRGMRETRKKGNFQGGGVPYGYYVKDKKLHIHEEHGAIVKYIFQQYTDGKTAQQIVDDLTAKGLMHKGKPFTVKTLYHIMRNEKYTGSYMLRDELVDKVYPAIISKEMFERAKAISNANKKGSYSIRTDYLLRSVVRCGYCGEPLIADSGTASSGVTYYYYACSGKKNKHNGCKKQSLIKHALETAVMDTIVEFMSKPAVVESIVEQVMAYQANMSKENSMLKIMQSQYESNKAMIQNTLNAIAQGIITRSTKEMLEQLEAQQLDLEEKIIIEKSKEIPILSREEVRTFYTKTLKSQGRALINLIVKEIIAYDDEIIIKLNTPLLEGPDDGQGFSICKRCVPLSNLIRLKMGQADKGICLILAV